MGAKESKSICITYEAALKEGENRKSLFIKIASTFHLYCIRQFYLFSPIVLIIDRCICLIHF